MGNVTYLHPSGSYGPVAASGYASLLPKFFNLNLVMILKLTLREVEQLSIHSFNNKMPLSQLFGDSHMGPCVLFISARDQISKSSCSKEGIEMDDQCYMERW